MMVALTAFATEVVETVNVAVEAPAKTVTPGGTVAAVWLLLREIDIPPVGAGPLRVTVPVELAPPVRVVGFKLNPDRCGGFTVNVAEIDVAPSVPVIFGKDWRATGEVVIENVALVVPAGTFTLAGTIALEKLLDRLTVVPPTGAGIATVTVPVEVVPPVTAVGLTLTPVNVWVTEVGEIVRTADLVRDPDIALIVAVVVDVTVFV